MGKSTLLNHLLGQKISITSRKPQTTRHRIMGVETEGAYQAIFVDTPGLHIEEKRAINRLMNRAANSSLSDVNLVLFLVDGTQWTPDDEMVLNKLRTANFPTVLLVNKVDNVKDRNEVMLHMQALSEKWISLILFQFQPSMVVTLTPSVSMCVKRYLKQCTIFLKSM